MHRVVVYEKFWISVKTFDFVPLSMSGRVDYKHAIPLEAS
jgi:hypothetical protein